MAAGEKMKKETIENLEFFLNRENEDTGTQEMIAEIADEILEECGCIYACDAVDLTDKEDITHGNLQEFANRFWDKVVAKIMDVIKTEE